MSPETRSNSRIRLCLFRCVGRWRMSRGSSGVQSRGSSGVQDTHRPSPASSSGSSSGHPPTVASVQFRTPTDRRQGGSSGHPPTVASVQFRSSSGHPPTVASVQFSVQFRTPTDRPGTAGMGTGTGYSRTTSLAGGMDLRSRFHPASAVRSAPPLFQASSPASFRLLPALFRLLSASFQPPSRLLARP